MRRNLRQFHLLSLIALGLSGPLLAQLKTPGLALRVLAKPQITGPCLASLLSPPSARQNCIQWNANVDAAPSVEHARRLVFVGAGDQYLHVLDADTGLPFLEIKTEGRVITETLFSADGSHFYFGTDKGAVFGYDAFNFKEIFSFQADGSINNDLLLDNNAIVFSTGLATVYRIDTLGKELWRLERPLSSNRLTLASNSNIVVLKDRVSGKVGNYLAIGHPEGYISIIHATLGAEDLRTIRLDGGGRPASFPDIIAPMIYLNNLLWVASFDRGIFVVDQENGHIRNRIEVTEVSQLALDHEAIYGATSNELFALSSMGEFLWRTDFSGIKTKEARYGFPFSRLRQGAKRVFMGVPSKLLIRNNKILMATSQGAMGEFSTKGALLRVVGNSLGFGPKIGVWEGQGVAASTRRGLLALFR